MPSPWSTPLRINRRTSRLAWRKEALTEAERAVKADRKVGLAYAAISNAMEPRDFAGRLDVLQRGLRSAPFDGHLNSYDGLMLADVGRPLEGLPFSRRGHEIDADAAPRAYANIDHLIATGLEAEARERLLQARRLWPRNVRNPELVTLLAVASYSPPDGAAAIKDLEVSFPEAAHADLSAARSSKYCGAVATDRLWLTRSWPPSDLRQTTIAAAYVALARLGYLDQAFEIAAMAEPEVMADLLSHAVRASDGADARPAAVHGPGRQPWVGSVLERFRTMAGVLHRRLSEI